MASAGALLCALHTLPWLTEKKWFASEALLLFTGVLGLVLWRERMRTKTLLFAILVLAAAGTNAIPFLPGSLSFMVELAVLPLALTVAAYIAMRVASKRRRGDGMPPNNAFESGPPSAAAQRER